MTEGVTSTEFANHADYRKRYFHLSINERQSLIFVKSSQAPQPGLTGSGERSGICFAPFTYDFTISFVRRHRTISMKVGVLQVKAREMAIKTTQLARRFVITSLLALLVPIVLLAPQAYAESYVAGQFGVTFPQSLSNVKLTQDGFGGLSSSDLSLKSSLMGGIKLGHFFSRARWLGIETELFYTTPHIKDQPVTISGPGGSGPDESCPTVSQNQTPALHSCWTRHLLRYPEGCRRRHTIRDSNRAELAGGSSLLHYSKLDRFWRRQIQSSPHRLYIQR